MTESANPLDFFHHLTKKGVTSLLEFMGIKRNLETQNADGSFINYKSPILTRQIEDQQRRSQEYLQSEEYLQMDEDRRRNEDRRREEDLRSERIEALQREILETRLREGGRLMENNGDQLAYNLVYVNDDIPERHTTVVCSGTGTRSNTTSTPLHTTTSDSAAENCRDTVSEVTTISQPQQQVIDGINTQYPTPQGTLTSEEPPSYDEAMKCQLVVI